MYTRTEVVGLKQNSAKPGRAATGLAALRMTTIDQADRLVLDFYRCAMLPLSPDAADTGHADDLSQIGADLPPAADPTVGWDAETFRRARTGPALRPRHRRSGAAQHRRRGQQRTRAGPAQPEYRCHPS